MFASSPVTLGMAIMSWRNLIAFSRLSSTFWRTFWWTLALIWDPPKITSAARRFHCSPCASRRRAGLGYLLTIYGLSRASVIGHLGAAAKAASRDFAAVREGRAVLV